MRERKRELHYWFNALLCDLLNSIFHLVDFTQNWDVFKDSVKKGEILKWWIIDEEEN